MTLMVPRYHEISHLCSLPGKDLTWWNKNKNKMDEDRAQAEMEKAQLRQLDEDLLNEAL